MNFTFNLLNSLDIFKKYQLEIDTLFRHVKWIDMMTGEMILTEELMNEESKPRILEQLPSYIKDLKITLMDDVIRVDLRGHMNGLSFEACCDMTVEAFEFTANCHKIVLSLHHESVRGEKGVLNRLIMKIMNRFFIERISKTMLAKTIKKQPGVTFDNDCHKIVVDLEHLPQFQKYLDIAVLGKPLISLVEMELLGLNRKGIRFKLLLLKPPIPSMKDVIGALRL